MSGYDWGDLVLDALKQRDETEHGRSGIGRREFQVRVEGPFLITVPDE